MSYCIAWLNIDSKNHQHQNVQEHTVVENLGWNSHGFVALYNSKNYKLQNKQFCQSSANNIVNDVGGRR